VFYPLFDRNIIFLQDGFYRVVNESEKKRYHWKTTEGIEEITHLEYAIEEDMIQVTSFKTATDEKLLNSVLIDLRQKTTTQVSKKIPMVLR
jgi:hypothetical protein